jgi:hypothetical protein
MTLILPRNAKVEHDEWKVYAYGQGISFSDYSETALISSIPVQESLLFGWDEYCLT